MYNPTQLYYWLSCCGFNLIDKLVSCFIRKCIHIELLCQFHSRVTSPFLGASVTKPRNQLYRHPQVSERDDQTSYRLVWSEALLHMEHFNVVFPEVCLCPCCRPFQPPSCPMPWFKYLYVYERLWRSIGASTRVVTGPENETQLPNKMLICGM